MALWRVGGYVYENNCTLKDNGAYVGVKHCQELLRKPTLNMLPNQGRWFSLRNRFVTPFEPMVARAVALYENRTNTDDPSVQSQA